MPESDGISFSTAISEGLADKDEIFQPLVRAVANFVATKVSPLSEVEIARLTDYEICRLFTRFSDAEIDRIMSAELSDFYTSIGQQISRQFDRYCLIFYLIFSFSVFGTFGFIVGLDNFLARYSKRDVLVTSNAAQERPELSERCLSLPHYLRRDAKGLKSIVETYIHENHMVFRQEVEKHQGSTSRAVVPSSRSTVDDSRSLS